MHWVVEYLRTEQPAHHLLRASIWRTFTLPLCFSVGAVDFRTTNVSSSCSVCFSYVFPPWFAIEVVFLFSFNLMIQDRRQVAGVKVDSWTVKRDGGKPLEKRSPRNFIWIHGRFLRSHSLTTDFVSKLSQPISSDIWLGNNFFALKCKKNYTSQIEKKKMNPLKNVLLRCDYYSSRLRCKNVSLFPKVFDEKTLLRKKDLNKNLVVNEKRWLPFLLTRKDDDLPTHRALS